jgi:NifB/MoaA-like Fe-S oxidoreductase
MRLPAERTYEDFPQVENGVGMVRRFEQDLSRITRLFPNPYGGNGIPDGRRARIVVATGRLFAGILGKRLTEALRRTAEAETCELEVRGVENRLFGSDVTVAGLLSGSDLLAGLRNTDPFDLAVLSPEMLNLEGVALDEMTPAAIARELGAPVQIGFGDESVLVRPDASDGDSRRQAKETGS